MSQQQQQQQQQRKRAQELRDASRRAVLLALERNLARAGPEMQVKAAELELELTDQRIKELHLQIDQLESADYQQRRK